MKAGDKIICPHCKQDTFVKEQAILDGWTIKEKILKCPLCDKKIADAHEESQEEKDEKKKVSLSALSNLLGGVELEKNTINISSDVKRFCKDCKNFVEHPFHTRCAHWDKDVDPMDDCEFFSPRKQTTTKPDNGGK